MSGRNQFPTPPPSPPASPPPRRDQPSPPPPERDDPRSTFFPLVLSAAFTLFNAQSVEAFRTGCRAIVVWYDQLQRRFRCFYRDTVIQNSGSRLEANCRRLVDHLSRRQPEPFRNFSFARAELRLTGVAKRTTGNSDRRLAFRRGENEFLVRAFFTFGYVTIPPGLVHVYQLLDVPLLAYRPVGAILPDHRMSFRDGDYHRRSVMRANGSYCFRAGQTCVVMAFQKTAFRLDVFREQEFERIRRGRWIVCPFDPEIRRPVPPTPNLSDLGRCPAPAESTDAENPSFSEMVYDFSEYERPPPYVARDDVFSPPHRNGATADSVDGSLRLPEFCVSNLPRTRGRNVHLPATVTSSSSMEEPEPEATTTREQTPPLRSFSTFAFCSSWSPTPMPTEGTFEMDWNERAAGSLQTPSPVRTPVALRLVLTPPAVPVVAHRLAPTPPPVSHHPVHVTHRPVPVSSSVVHRVVPVSSPVVHRAVPVSSLSPVPSAHAASCYVYPPPPHLSSPFSPDYSVVIPGVSQSPEALDLTAPKRRRRRVRPYPTASVQTPASVSGVRVKIEDEEGDCRIIYDKNESSRRFPCSPAHSSARRQSAPA